MGAVTEKGIFRYIDVDVILGNCTISVAGQRLFIT